MLFSTATTNFSQEVPVTFSTSGSLQRVPEVYEMFGKPEVSFFKRKKNSLILNVSPRMTLKGLNYRLLWIAKSFYLKSCLGNFSSGIAPGKKIRDILALGWLSAAAF